MTQALTQSYSLYQNHRSLLVKICVFACISMAVWYGVSVYTLVSNAISLRNIEKEISSLSSEIGDLDAQYIKMSEEITSDKLTQFGLSKGEVAVFIPKTASLGNVVGLVSHGL